CAGNQLPYKVEHGREDVRQAQIHDGRALNTMERIRQGATNRISADCQRHFLVVASPRGFEPLLPPRKRGKGYAQRHSCTIETLEVSDLASSSVHHHSPLSRQVHSVFIPYGKIWHRGSLMARTVRNPKIDTRSARARLPARREPYWTVISAGCALGY